MVWGVKNLAIQKISGIESAFFDNPASIELKNQVLADYYKEYLVAETNRELKQIKLKISVATYLSITARLIEGYGDTLEDHVKSSITPNEHDNYELCNIIQIFVHLKVYIRNHTEEKNDEPPVFKCEEEDNVLDKLEFLKEMILEGNFIEFYFSVMENESFLEFLGYQINNKDESELAELRGKFEYIFGFERFALLSERFSDIFEQMVNPAVLIGDLYKIYFTPRDTSMTDWKSLIVLEYIIYMELTRNELSKLQVEEDEEEEKIKIVDHMHTTANTFKINFWKARNFKGEINDLEIEDLFINQNEMCIFYHGSKDSYLQMYKKCTEKIVKEIQKLPKKSEKGRKSRGKQHLLDTVQKVNKYWYDCVSKYYNNEDNKEFNEKERTLMHLNKINELLNNEEFKQFLQYEASGAKTFSILALTTEQQETSSSSSKGKSSKGKEKVAYGAVQTVTPKKPTKGPKKGYISSVDRKGITIEEVTKKEKKKKSKQVQRENPVDAYLYQLIENEYCIHENIIQARNGVLNVLGQVIKQWIESVKENKGLSTNSEEEEFQLLKGGSDILGTTAHWSDMDILCILPKYVNIYDFIEEDASGLYGSLMAIMSSDNINVVKTSRILMLEFTMFEIDVDLIYAQIPFEKIETDFDIMDDEIIEGNKNARSILALAGKCSLFENYKAGLYLSESKIAGFVNALCEDLG
uniref:Polymerase nucleotidyl transferase domain-containing protein n=1 Tax=Meloidogyne floridensis TaxID=298350 RepID=A0A915P8C6_9BILA